MTIKAGKSKVTRELNTVWTEEEITKFVTGAPAHVARILKVAVETGLRPADLLLLERSHVGEPDAKGKRFIRMEARKTGRSFAIPVTRKLADLLAEMPEDQERVLVNKRGQPFRSPEFLSRLVRQWREKLGLRRELRLFDARATAFARLVEAGFSADEIADHMGCSAEHAAALLARYKKEDA